MMHSDGQVTRLWDELLACRGDADCLIAAVVRYVAELVGDTCVLALLSEDGLLLEPAATYHRLPAVRELMHEVLSSAPSRVGQGLAGTVAADRRSLLIPRVDPDEVAAWIDPRYRKFLEKYPIRSVLIVPMFAYSELVGTLGVVRSETLEPYGEEDLRIMNDLAERAALALVDARREPRQLTADDYRALFEHSPEGVLFTVPSGRVLAANPAACELLGRSENEICALGRAGLLFADDPQTRAAVEARSRSGRARAELRMRRGDGTSFTADVSSTIFVSPTGDVRACVAFRDVTHEIALREELERRRAEVQYLVDHDAATKLLNRRGLVVAGETAIEYASLQGVTVQVLLFEVTIPGGGAQLRVMDTAMRRVADVVAGGVRPVDLVGRTADGEVAVVLLALTEDDALHLCRAIVDQLSASAGDLQVGVGMSMRGPRDSTGLLELLGIAAERAKLDVVRDRLRRRFPPPEPM